MELQEDLKIYSEEVRDVLTTPPKSIYQWGNTIVFIFVVLLFLISWFISYPDIVRGQVVITTTIPPEKLISKANGKIEVILVEDNEIVHPENYIAILENAAKLQDVLLLKKVCDTIKSPETNFPFELFKNAQLGDVETSFANFQREYIANNLNEFHQPFQKEMIALTKEKKQLQERLQILIAQKSINNQELVLQKSELDRFKQLFEKGVISKSEMESKQLNYLQAEKSYKSLLSSISSLNSSINDLNRNSENTKINENREVVNLNRSLQQNFYFLKKAIKDWELQYVFKSSLEGRLSYLQLWSENQFIQAGEPLFAVVPLKSKNYIGKIVAPSINSGKIKIGQKVNVKLLNYPDKEFGILSGIIKSVALTPNREGNLLIDIELPNGLVTSYNKEIYFQQEMSGTAEIVTEDLKLIERLLYQFREIFSR